MRILVSSQGQVWAAGSHNGQAATAYLDGNQWVKQVHPELSWGIDYRAVFEDRKGNIWFGGSVDIAQERGQLGGLLQLTDPQGPNQNWVHHHSGNGLKQSNAYGIGQSADGRIWVGGGRLWTYDGQKWEVVQENNLQDYVNEVISVDGLLLVGSRYYGIYEYDDGTWKHYDTESGLISNTIISLYAGNCCAATMAPAGSTNHRGNGSVVPCPTANCLPLPMISLLPIDIYPMTRPRKQSFSTTRKRFPQKEISFLPGRDRTIWG